MRNRRSGFTIIEVLIAITTLVSSVFVLNDLQVRSLFRVLKNREEIDRVFLVKKEVYHEYLNPDKAGKRRTTALEEPDVKIFTEELEIAPKSELAPLKDFFKLIQAEGAWKSGPSKRQVKMVTLLRKPPEDEDKKKK